MKLIGLKLKNFRSYSNITFDMSENMHMIVGMNDIGKSSILEALDIFFEVNAQSKVTYGDLCIQRSDPTDKYIIISCEFEIGSNEKVIIDSTREVYPKDEFLLNAKGNLEIRKTWDCNLKTPKLSRTEIVCFLPDCIDVNCLTMKITEIKRKLVEIAPESTANRSVNSEMRKAIYERVLEDNPNHTSSEKVVDTKSLLDDKEFYSSLEKSLPDFYLFKSDRKNTTTDDEVQNPLSIAVKNALDNEEVKQKLNDVQNIIENELQQINTATISQMKRFSNRLGNSLIPQINTNWTKAINNDILDQNSIPINKKGSGIRRLLLLSYLMVQAKSISSQRGKKDIIYAIEEPETSLHPKLQEQFMKELYYMANSTDYSLGEEISSCGDDLLKYKIIITTHLPNYLAYATQKQVIYISEDAEGRPIEITGEIEYKKIKEELGLLPNPYYGFVVFVEGENDKRFLLNLNKVGELKAIFNLEADDVNIIPLQGSRLLDSIEYDFYNELPVKQFHLYDSDVQKYVDFINNEVIGKENCDGIVTKRRCMEYYIPASLINYWLNVDIKPYLNQYQNNDFSLFDAILNINNNNDRLNGIRKTKDKQKALKAFLNTTAMKGVTKEILVEFKVYDEIKTWFEKMAALKASRH